MSTYITLLSANPTKWSNTLKQFVGKLPTNCFSVVDHFVKLALKGLNKTMFSVGDFKFKVKITENNQTGRSLQVKQPLGQ